MSTFRGPDQTESCIAEATRLRLELEKWFGTDEKLRQCYYICLKKTGPRSHVFHVKCHHSSRLYRKHMVDYLSTGFCLDRMGNRDGELEQDTSVTNFFRPHCAEMLAFTEDGGMGCGYPDLGDVVSFWRADGTDSHVPEIVDFLRRLEDES